MPERQMGSGDSEILSGGGFPSGWSCSFSLVGSSRGAAIIVAGEGSSEGSVAMASWWPRIPDSCIFPQDVLQRGESEMRPERGRVVIAGTAGMVACERDFYGRVLYTTIIGQSRSVVTPEALAAAMESHYAVRRTAAKVEVTCPPFHFFVRFDSKDDCTRVVHVSEQLHCCGSRISFQRWSSFSRGKPGKLEHKTMLSLEGMMEEAWDPHTVNLVLAGVYGELIDMLPATDKWVLSVIAWLHDPCGVSKVLTVSVPAPPNGPWKPDSDNENAHSPPAPNSPTERATVDFPVIMHVKEVVDHGPLLSEGLALEFLPHEDEDLTRKHIFTTWRDKIDGTSLANMTKLKR
ncbi:hypothetical protein ZWY2020_056874 [Hordeum vulgare]|nr:hypothetical protein ZWY2020_056874 [Hordeum vulgare]